MRALAAAAATALASLPLRAEDEGPFHFQATVATQAHPSFHAAYSGKNSLDPDGESATSVVMDLSLTVHPWRGAELVVGPELAGGKGLSSTLGVAAFPSGEVYRVGNPEPTLILGRTTLKQVLGEWTFFFGKLSTPDLFDNVPYANDPHTRFMSWGVWASAAYDYPADVHGYTIGLAAQWSRDWLSARGGMFLEPVAANSGILERDITKARGLVAEVEARFSAWAARMLAFLNTAHMGSYSEAIARQVDVTQTRADGRTKVGFAASANRDFGAGLGGFVRLSWNDGNNETWAFTEIDRSLVVGALQSGARWGREGDEAGAAIVVSGLSNRHRRYLEQGGYGFLIGDGALTYGAEVLGELFYRAALTKLLSVGVNYQPLFNPAFNRDRGPVHIFTGRVHVAF
jgi:high affinity Mn2+ porin